MPKTIAEERIKVVALTTKPANIHAPKISELAAGKDLSCKILFSDFRLSPTASDTVNEPALCEPGNSAVPTKSNFEGSLTVFRFLDPATGLAVSAEDEAWDLLKAKGTELWLYVRIGLKYNAAFAAGQDVELYHALTDEPQAPSDLGGYIKKVVPLFVQGDSRVSNPVAA